MAANITTHDPSKSVVTEDGEVIALRDPVKTVGAGDEEIELRQLTQEEKAARRFRKNLVVWSLGIIILIATMYFMR